MYSTGVSLITVSSNHTDGWISCVCVYVHVQVYVVCTHDLVNFITKWYVCTYSTPQAVGSYLKPFHITVECTSKPDQTISHLNWIDRNAYSILLHVIPLRGVNWPDLMRISSISKGAPYSLQISRVMHDCCNKTKATAYLVLYLACGSDTVIMSECRRNSVPFCNHCIRHRFPHNN